MYIWLYSFSMTIILLGSFHCNAQNTHDIEHAESMSTGQMTQQKGADPVDINISNTLGSLRINDGTKLDADNVNIKSIQADSITIKTKNVVGGDTQATQGSSISIGTTQIGNQNMSLTGNSGTPDSSFWEYQTLNEKHKLLYMPPAPSLHPGDDTFWTKLGYNLNDIIQNFSYEQDQLRYDLYERSLHYYNLAKMMREMESIARNKGDNIVASELEAKYYKYIDIFNKYNQALNSVTQESLISSAAYPYFVYESSKLAAEIVASATGNPLIKNLVMGQFMATDYFINLSDPDKGRTYANNALLLDLAVLATTKIPWNGETSIDKYIHRKIGFIGKTNIYNDLSNFFESSDTKKALMRAAHKILKIPAEEITKQLLEIYCESLLLEMKNNLELELKRENT